ncbi:cyclopropane-fatty-acyl-phospholipid synthase family protein [Streptomyces sp. NPDC006540]|uniref:cyclopropane-fatty-acyl-phospholipid synthase family protein n=1 Tax=Streptomyces sp. NPDC006540 TaxID=3155353 RepID=UPI0033B68121
MSVPVISATPRTASVDPRRRPDVARLPKSSWLRAAAAERRMRHTIGRLPLRIRLAGTARPVGRGGPLMEVRDPHSFFRRTCANGLVGFKDSYTAGEWDTTDLVGVLTVLAEHADALVPEALERTRGARRAGESDRHTPKAARADAAHELLSLFLDETLTYSCALFRGFPAEHQLLSAAQHRKIDRLLDLAHVGPSTQLLEMGSGRGELAVRAAGRGARVLTVTHSAEQQALAARRVRAAGVGDRVTVLLRDYRRVLGRYDAIVGVETVEAVGAGFWPEYLMMLDRLLAPGGRAALQAVTMPQERTPASRAAGNWAQKYICPAGPLPSAQALEEFTGRFTGLSVTARDAFGAHYAETLRLWRERFTARAAEADALGFDETFRRLWHFCLAHAEAGFRSGLLDVQQLQLTKPAEGVAG